MVRRRALLRALLLAALTPRASPAAADFSSGWALVGAAAELRLTGGAFLSAYGLYSALLRSDGDVSVLAAHNVALGAAQSLLLSAGGLASLAAPAVVAAAEGPLSLLAGGSFYAAAVGAVSVGGAEVAVAAGGWRRGKAACPGWRGRAAPAGGSVRSLWGGAAGAGGREEPGGVGWRCLSWVCSRALCAQCPTH